MWNYVFIFLLRFDVSAKYLQLILKTQKYGCNPIMIRHTYIYLFIYISSFSFTDHIYMLSNRKQIYTSVSCNVVVKCASMQFPLLSMKNCDRIRILHTLPSCIVTNNILVVAFQQGDRKHFAFSIFCCFIATDEQSL